MTRTYFGLTMIFAAILFIAGCDGASTGSNGGGSTAGGTETAENGEAAKKPATEDDIKKMLEDLRVAVENGDSDALDKIYADDYMIVSQTGVMETKAQRMESMKSGSVKYESVEFKDPKIRMYGDTAVVVMNAVGKGTVDGAPLNLNSMATIVFAHTADGWREVSAQLTNIEAAEKKEE